MRESNDASARMIQLMCDGAFLSRRAFRSTPGSPAFAHMFPSSGKTWLRLTRSGNTFSAYHALDGSNWEIVFTTLIPMGSCINVGLITMNGASTGAVTGHFANVSINSIASLTVSPDVIQTQTEGETTKDFQVFPNPASDRVNIQLQEFEGEQVELRIYNQSGQLVLQKQWLELYESTPSIQLADWLPGIYMVEVKSAQYQQTRKLVINR